MIRSENDLKNAFVRVFSERIIHTTIAYVVSSGFIYRSVHEKNEENKQNFNC